MGACIQVARDIVGGTRGGTACPHFSHVACTRIDARAQVMRVPAGWLLVRVIKYLQYRRQQVQSRSSTDWL